MTREEYIEYANSKGYQLGKIFDKMLIAVEKCNGYCPCKYAIYQSTKPDELEDIKCPCKFIDEDIEQTGHCHCHMFTK